VPNLHPFAVVPRFSAEEALAKLEMEMLKKFALPALLTVLTLAGCAGRERVGVAVAAGGPDYYDGYYDGYYGPFVDGYWGGDGAFWYQDGGHAWHSDTGGHFRHDGAGGFNHIHGSGIHREH
jgi:hypothetical protein